MKRQAIDDGTWFDLDAATAFEESTWWNGNNHISKATGSQWEHEILYRTKGGAWILHHWSQWQGAGESYVRITDADAAGWFVANEHAPHPACAEDVAALEVR